MEILKNGCDCSFQRIEFHCKECGCVFETNLSECQKATQQEWFNQNFTNKCKCPNCGNIAHW